MLTIGAPGEVGEVCGVTPQGGCACLVPRVQLDDVISTGGGKLVVIFPGYAAHTPCSAIHGDIPTMTISWR